METNKPYVLLVDDDEASHFIHKRLIKKKYPNAKVVGMTDGRAALRLLLETNQNDEECPSHIWLDLKMPAMDGWSFLDAVAVNAARLQCRPAITIVSSSPNPDDRARAETYPVTGFMEKYMSVEDVDTLLAPN